MDIVESHAADTLIQLIRTNEYILDKIDKSLITTNKAINCKHTTNIHICTYFLPESGIQRQQGWQRWHRGHPDTQRAIGMSSKAGTTPLHLWTVISVIHKQENHVHQGEHFLSWATEDFTQGRTAKLHIQGNWRFQKAKFWQRQHIAPIESVQHLCEKHALKTSTHWLSTEIQSQGKREKFIIHTFPAVLDLNMKVILSHVDSSQLSDSRQHSSQFPAPSVLITWPYMCLLLGANI